MKTQNCAFLATVLGVGAGHDTAGLANQSPFHPQLPGAVKELAHLPAHITKSGRSAEDNTIRLTQFFYRTDWNLLLQLLAGYTAHLLYDFSG